MRISPDCKLQKLTNGSTHGSTRCAQLDCNEGSPVVVATNGHALAVVAVTTDDGETITDGPIATGSIVASQKKPAHGNIQLHDENGIRETVVATASGTERADRNGYPDFPQWRKVIAGAKDAGSMRHPIAVESISLSPRLLLDLALALGAAGTAKSPKGVTLTFYGDSSAILVESTTSGNYGVIMPTVRV